MADMADFRPKRKENEENQSRVFDETMGLGDCVDSSHGSATCSKGSDHAERLEWSDGETKELEEKGTIRKDSVCSPNKRRKDSMEGDYGEKVTTFPSQMSPSLQRSSNFIVATGGGVGLEDVINGLPADFVHLGEEEEEGEEGGKGEENWNLSLPMDAVVDGDHFDRTAKQSVDTQTGDSLSCTKRYPEGLERADSPGAACNSREHCQVKSASTQSEEMGTQQLERSESVFPESVETDHLESPISPLLKIKDEPMDEGYDSALLPQASLRQIKEELEHEEDELRISSVYSVGGNSFASPSVPAAQPAAAIGPAINAVLPSNVVAAFPIKPPALTPIQPRIPPPAIGNARCSGCCKILMKGQTAFQRKGSTQLFCSTVCLTGYLPPTNKARTCYQCLKPITNPKEVIMAPVDVNTYMHFCSQFCLTVFGRKKKTPPQIEKPACRVCKVTTKIEHEVTHLGYLHRLCSDRCFALWRSQRLLAMNCCESCSMYCKTNSSSCQTLTIDSAQLNFCSPTCVDTYKQTCSKMTPCGNCNNLSVVSSTLMETDHAGKVSLYCSTACVDISRPPKHTLTGTPFPCTHCTVNVAPQYHLVMEDGTICNFCSINCVSAHRQTEHSKPPDQANGLSSNTRTDSHDESPKSRTGPGAGSCEQAPYPSPCKGPTPGPVPSQNTTLSPASKVTGTHPIHSSQVPMPYLQPSTPVQSGGSSRFSARLLCQHCNKLFITKPILFSFKGRVLMFCDKFCNEQYNTKHRIVARCAYCALEKVVYEVMHFNLKERIFCSESCKLLYKHDLIWKKKDTWRLCAYCSSVNTQMLHSHFGGKMEEFCTPECMSQYTVLFYGMGRCGSCGRQGYQLEKLQCGRSVRQFCNLPCLLEYCAVNLNPNSLQSNAALPMKTQPPPYAPAQPHRSKMNPVIANVVSLANGSDTQPHVNADSALTGALPTSNSIGKNLDHASTQTDAMRVPVARRKPMKNKAILCKPFTLDQEVQCVSTLASETPAVAEEKVKVMVVPIPVPVFIPVPMNMYTQYFPVAMAMPLPVPVPIVLPSLSAERQNKKMKDVGTQLEARAEVIREKGKPVPHADQSSSWGLDTESDVALSPPISGEQSAGRGSTTGPAKPRNDQGVGTSSPLNPSTQKQDNPKDVVPLKTSSSSDVQSPPSPMTDLEADYPIELFEDAAVEDHSMAPPQRGLKRSRDDFSPRKRSRWCIGSMDPQFPGPSKLHHMYGVNAWRDWVAQRNKHSDYLTDALFRPVVLKEDVLRCNSAELSYGLCRFIKEVRRPGGKAYAPDSIFYLCLGIQRYLFEMGRIENIFTDDLYSRFAREVSGILLRWGPTLLPSGALYSRVEESFLWECKQLGAFSPMVLLNTLLFFCTKALGLTTLAEHRRLSFSNFSCCTRPGPSAYLRYQALAQEEHAGTEAMAFPAKRKLEDEEADVEIPENTVNPLRCPVRLYEFYLSKCPETAKKRTNVFYLQPEQTLHPNSPRWYTSKPLEGSTLESLLTRILTVRVVHQEPEEAAQQQQQHLAPYSGSTDGDDDSSLEGPSRL